MWSQRREASFRRSITKAGFSVKVYTPPRARQDRQWEREQPILSSWLSNLPRPTGVMACNDDLLAELSDPPLSSVALNAEGTGYRTAALLDQMMRQRLRKPRRLTAKALHVVTRRSTNIGAIDDPEVAAALRFIHSHATEPIQIESIVRHLEISRRSIEMRFHRCLGRTLHAEIHRIRMERARRFLLETDLPIPKVAEAVGCNTPSYFIQVFRAEHDMTPVKFRRQLRH